MQGVPRTAKPNRGRKVRTWALCAESVKAFGLAAATIAETEKTRPRTAKRKKAQNRFWEGRSRSGLCDR